jgi:hypothetical protein
MYDPQTVAHEIKYPWRGAKSKFWPKGYRSSFITIWHVDPENANSGNRRDDSCGWFDRTPGRYADAVAYLLKDTSFMHDVRLILDRRVTMPYPFYEGVSEEQMFGKRLPAGDALALVLMVASGLELRRWWNGEKGNGGAHASWWLKTFSRRRNVTDLAASLALNSTDNLSRVESPDAAIRLTAAALNRHFRPWWKHPRWHFWHWKFQVHPWQQFKRWAFHRCAHCKKGFKWGYCPTSHGGDSIYHSECSSIVWARDRKPSQPDPSGIADAIGESVH